MKFNITNAAFKAAIARMARSVLGKDVAIRDADPNIAPGYTEENGTIYIAEKHPLWEKLSPEKQYAMRKGICVHEILHQLYTNFKKEKFVLDTLPSRERKLFAEFANILEDPAIEHMAPLAFGGPALKALRFAIAETYNQSHEIQEAKTPFSQYMSALIQFGDLGLPKGHFTFPEAQKVFAKTAPKFYKGIIETNGAKRVDIAKEIFEDSRCLWAPELDKAEEKFMEMLKDLLKEFGKMQSKGSGEGESPDSDSVDESDSLSKARKATVLKVSKEEFDELSKNAKESSGSSGNADLIIECDDKDASNDEGSGQSGNGNKPESDESKNQKNGQSGNDSSEDNGSSGKENGSNDTNNSGKKGGSDKNNSGDKQSSNAGDESNACNDSKSDSKSNHNKNDKGRRLQAKEGSGKIGHYSNPEKGDNASEQIDTEDYELTDEDIEYIRSEAAKIQDSFDKKESEEDTSTPEDFDIETPSLKGLSVLNKNIFSSGDMSEEYAKYVAKVAPQIRATVTQLRKIFDMDYEEKLHAQNGSINILRAHAPTVSTRIFDRRRVPNGKRDVAVAILVDESGSMSWGNKYSSAKESCIALTEIFERLQIPVYVMGFTADEQRYDIVHNHYIKWKITPKTKESLLNISARSDNCDGYSIRYISKILSKRKETNKLLIVLSDGQPACHAYCRNDDGIADTKAAIREAKKKNHVLGVAIGNSDTDTIYNMYERNFLHISEVSELFNGLQKEIRNIFKNI